MVTNKISLIYVSKLFKEKNHESETNINRIRPNYGYISVPYIKGASQRACKLLCPYYIKFEHIPEHTLTSKLFAAKDRRETMGNNRVIYKIKCNERNKEYIGETGKELKKRIIEHKNGVGTTMRFPLNSLPTHPNIESQF